MFFIRNKKGQTALEYTIIMIIVMAALLTVGTYYKRGIQGKWKSAVDGLGDQYDPRHGKSLIKHTLKTNVKTEIFAEGDDDSGWWTSRVDNTNMLETKTGYISTESVVGMEY